VVDREDVVVDDALDEVEQAPAHQHPSPQRARCPHPAARARDPGVEHAEAREHREPRDGVEQAVPQRVHLQAVDGGRRELPDRDVGGGGAREHVVPLEDLVQQDAVDEAAHADAQQQTGEGEADGAGARVGVALGADRVAHDGTVGAGPSPAAGG